DEWSTRTVGEVMVPADKGITVSADTPMTEVITNLAEATGGRLLVMSNGKLEGIITRSDLARWMERLELLSRGENEQSGHSSPPSRAARLTSSSESRRRSGSAAPPSAG